MDFNRFRNRSITTGKGLLGVFSLCVVAVALFILIAGFYHTGVINVKAIIAMAIGAVGFYTAMKRKVE